jgi:hypothetical protein
MKNKIHVFAMAAFVAFLSSCGSNSADTETTASIDTSAVTPMDTTTTAIVSVPATTAIVDVPEKTKTVFKEKYPKATKVKWESHKPDTRAVEWDLAGWPEVDEGGRNAWFHWQGNETKAYYDEKSNWVGTVEITDPASLPKAVTSTLNQQFDGYTVTSVKKENDKSRTAYEITLEKGSGKVKALIDENGKVLKKKTV